MQLLLSRLGLANRRRLAAVAVVVSIAALFGATRIALASQPAGPQSNNGTVKIHDGASEPSPVTKDQPHVCTFHVHAMFFDPGQALTFDIKSWPPTGPRVIVLSGAITTDADGAGRAPAVGAYSLPDGHYKLFVHTGASGGDKQKVFWVRCAPTNSTSKESTTTQAPPGPTTTLPPTPTSTVEGTSPTQPSTPTSAAAGGALTSTPSTQVSGGLAFTGASALPLLLAALALLAIGGATLFSARRRASER
jgi:hypothetical protein